MQAILSTSQNKHNIVKLRRLSTLPSKMLLHEFATEWKTYVLVEKRWEESTLELEEVRRYQFFCYAHQHYRCVDKFYKIICSIVSVHLISDNSPMYILYYFPKGYQ